MRHYEDELSIEVGDEDIPVTVTYCVHGKYIPETWGYSGGSPAEYPEVEVIDLCHSENTDKKFEFNQVFNQRPPLDKKWEPTPGLIDYDSWEAGALEDAADQGDEDRAEAMIDAMQDRDAYYDYNH